MFNLIVYAGIKPPFPPLSLEPSRMSPEAVAGDGRSHLKPDMAGWNFKKDLSYMQAPASLPVLLTPEQQSKDAMGTAYVGSVKDLEHLTSRADYQFMFHRDERIAPVEGSKLLPFADVWGVARPFGPFRRTGWTIVGADLNKLLPFGRPTIQVLHQTADYPWPPSRIKLHS